jgi:hypothetical protein
VTTGFQRDEERGSACGWARCGQGVHFRMRTTEAFVPAFANNLALVIGNDGAHRSNARCIRASSFVRVSFIPYWPGSQSLDWPAAAAAGASGFQSPPAGTPPAPTRLIESQGEGTPNCASMFSMYPRICGTLGE